MYFKNAVLSKALIDFSYHTAFHYFHSNVKKIKNYLLSYSENSSTKLCALLIIILIVQAVEKKCINIQKQI